MKKCFSRFSFFPIFLSFFLFSVEVLEAAASREVLLNLTIEAIAGLEETFESKTSSLTGKVMLGKDSVYRADLLEVDLTSLNSGMETRDSHMRDKYLKTQDFPKALLKNLSAKNGTFEAMLTLKGVEKKVLGTYQVKGKEVTAVFNVKISDYPIENPKFMTMKVKDSVEVKVRLDVDN